MSIIRLKTTWNSANIGFPGYTFFYVATDTLTPSLVAAFWSAIAAYFPPSLNWTVSGDKVVIDEATGKMISATTGPGAGPIAGTGTTTYVAQAGAQVKWGTAGIVDGKHVTGRTYLVPMTTTQFVAGGTINQTTCNTINAAADALRTSSGAQLCIWSRPVFKKDANGHPTDEILRPGTRHLVTGVATPTKSVTLNSRRDN